MPNNTLSQEANEALMNLADGYCVHFDDEGYPRLYKTARLSLGALIDEARAFCFKSDAPICDLTHEESHQLMADFAAEQLRLQREQIAQNLDAMATFTGGGKYGIVDRDEYRGYIKHLRGEK